MPLHSHITDMPAFDCLMPCLLHHDPHTKSQAVLATESATVFTTQQLQAALRANRSMQSAVRQREDPTEVAPLLLDYFGQYAEATRNAFAQLSEGGGSVLSLQVRVCTTTLSRWLRCGGGRLVTFCSA